MKALDIMRERHSVRQYMDKAIEAKKRERLKKAAEECNRESGLKRTYGAIKEECKKICRLSMK